MKAMGGGGGCLLPAACWLLCWPCLLLVGFCRLRQVELLIESIE